VDVLVLGGSVFLGRAVATEALALGADVTVFNRGRSGSPPPGVTHVLGDRTKADDLAQLSGRHFDLVVDTSGYVPADVRASAELLVPSADHYAFVSSVNAHPGWPATADYHAAGVHDGDPDATEAPADLDPAQSYGWLKVGCERAVTRAFGPQRSAILRGGSIVGPHDSAVGRLPWWIGRVARGGDVLVPGSADAPISLIDARDLARFALSRAPGTFEVSGPVGRDTWADLLAACATATGTPATFTYVGDEWLAEQGVQYWTEIPLWIPPAEGPGVWRHRPEDAEAAGLTWRPLAETVADTWAWQQSVPGGWRPAERTPGLAPEREQELLAAWHAQGTERHGP
jgi:nucleoside-diphosphate-sugar epimerase